MFLLVFFVCGVFFTSLLPIILCPVFLDLVAKDRIGYRRLLVILGVTFVSVERV